MKFFLGIFFLGIFTAQAYAMTIATGSKSGNYYKIGKNLNKKVFNGKAKVLNTAGSVENMLLVAQGKVDIALVQSDALAMLNIFYSDSGKTADDLVDIVGKLYTETVHVIVHKDSNINLISDLDGTVMVSGGKQSGSSVTATFIENRHNISFKKIVNTSIKKGLDLLSEKKVDVVFYTAKSPSSLLKKYKNVRLISREYILTDNRHIKDLTLKKNKYKFLEEDLNVYGVDTVIITKKGYKDIKKIAKFLNIKNFKKSKSKSNSNKKQAKFITIPKDKLTIYTKRYGNRAILKLNYYNVQMNKLKKAKLTKKLLKVNEFINKIHFASDKQHWRKENYWSTPLEFFGTGYGDTEEFAMIKALFLIKLGVDKNKLKLIKKNIPIVVKNKKYKEHISLAYFHKKGSSPIILDYNKDDFRIYKLKKEFKYTVIKKANNKKWNKFFTKNLTTKDIDKIISDIKSKK